MAVLQAQGLEKIYQAENGEVTAFQDISFTVEKGQFISIVGPSGCGKSTLLSTLAGLLEPTAGGILIDGRPCRGISAQIGYMMQRDALLEWRTIWKNVLFGLEVRGQVNSETQSRARRLLESYGLWAFKDKYPRQLSGGMRQRAALIRTLAAGPEILLLDEAFSALDYQTRLQVTEDVYAILKREGVTTLMVTHDIPEAISMADRVLILSARPGRLRRDVPIQFPGLEHRTPLTCRSHPRFQTYFEIIWKELTADERP